MAEVKEGESIKNVVEGFDEDGKLISRVTYEWFGYSNEEHNKSQLDMAQRTVDLVRGWADRKASAHPND